MTKRQIATALGANRTEPLPRTLGTVAEAAAVFQEKLPGPEPRRQQRQVTMHLREATRVELALWLEGRLLPRLVELPEGEYWIVEREEW